MAQPPRNNSQPPILPGETRPFNAATPLVLKLYIADSSPNSLQAIGNLHAALHKLPSESYQLEVIDGLFDPLRAINDGILVTPTLLKIAPLPTVSLLGDLHDLPQLLRVLGIAEEAT